MHPYYADFRQPNNKLKQPQKTIFKIIILLTFWFSSPKNFIENIKDEIVSIVENIHESLFNLYDSIIGIIILPMQVIIYFLIGCPIILMLSKTKFGEKFLNFLNKGLKKEVRKIQE